MKGELSRKEITRCIVNGFEVYIEYRVELGRKIWKKSRKAHILGKIRAHVPVRVKGVPIHVVFCFPVSTSFCILTITCSFLIQFELFKCLFKIDFMENQKYRNMHHQILILGGPKIHSKWGHVQANSYISLIIE